MQIIKLRRFSQIASILIICWAMYALHNKFFYFALVTLLVIISSILFGRAFCSWICPFGTIYEFSGIIRKRNKPRYHCRIGCPMSLIIGNVNRFSIIQIYKDESLCLNCDSCRIACPVGVFEIADEKDERNPQKLYACIRCLNCVDVCPNKALKLKLELKFRLLQNK